MYKFLLILSILASANALAGVNKWVDDQGQVHYSDQAPPTNTKTQSLGPETEDADSAGSGAPETKTLAEREMDLKKEKAEKKAEADKSAQNKAREDAMKVNCKTAQDNLRTLQSGIRIVDIQPNGERAFIDDAQKQQRIDKAQQDIGAYCK